MNENLEISASVSRRVAMAVGALILGAFAGLVLGFSALKFAARWATGDALRTGLYLMIGGAIIGLVGAWWQSSYKTIVTRDALEIYRGGKLWQSLPRASTSFSSKVTYTRTNGVRSGARRELIVTNAAGEAEYALPGFDKRRFSLLMNTLNPISGEDGLVSPQMRDQPVPTITYPVDATAISKPLKDTRLMFIFFMALAAIFVGVIAWFTTPGDLAVSIMAAAICAVVLSPVLAIIWVTTGRSLERVPHQFTVGSAGVEVDGQRFDPASLVRIELPPPGYKVGDAWLTITAGDQSHQYYLGPVAKLKDAFSNYDAFIKHLAHATINRPGLVHFDIA